MKKSDCLVVIIKKNVKGKIQRTSEVLKKRKWKEGKNKKIRKISISYDNYSQQYFFKD